LPGQVFQVVLERAKAGNQTTKGTY